MIYSIRKKTNPLVFMSCTKVMLSRISFLQNKTIIIIFMYLGVMYLAENDVCVYCEFISTENTAEKYA